MIAPGQTLLEGRTAVVTGASRGIGRAITQAFVAHGARVIGTARSIDPADWATADHVVPVALDLSNADTISDAVKAIRAVAPDGVDVLVNNAGMAHGGLFQMTRPADLRAVFEANLFGPLAFTQQIARLMRKRPGAIVNIASTAAMIADPGTMTYGSSKAAFIRATQSMAQELAAQGVRVNAIAPGVTRTQMLDEMDPQAAQRLIDASALKTAAEPEDIAHAALFLASDMASHITGQVLRVDGGLP